jgi:hypothetical protein
VRPTCSPQVSTLVEPPFDEATAAAAASNEPGTGSDTTESAAIPAAAAAEGSFSTHSRCGESSSYDTVAGLAAHSGSSSLPGDAVVRRRCASTTVARPSLPALLVAADEVLVDLGAVAALGAV